MSSRFLRIVPGALFEAADVAIGARDDDIVWTVAFLLGDDFCLTGRLLLESSYLPLVYDPDLADHVYRGLEKLVARDLGLRFDGREVSLEDCAR